MRRLAPLATAAVLAASLTASPAWGHAAHGQFLQWNGPEAGQELSGDAVHIAGTISFGMDGVKSWAVEVVAPEGQARPSFGTICEEAVGGAPRSIDFDCEWDTTGYPDDGGLSHNGDYVVRVRAENASRGTTPTETHVAERSVTLVNPVAAPTGVKLTFVEPSREATVQWAPNPEPDVARYVVQQRNGNGPWQTAGETGPKVTRLTRKLAPGNYSFQVAAVRPGPMDKPLQSAWSGPAAEPKQVIVAEAPAASTTSSTAPQNQKEEVNIPTDQPGPSDSPASAAAGPGAAPAPGTTGPEPAPTGNPYYTRIQSGTPGSVTSEAKFGTPRAAAAAPAPRPAAKPKEYIEPDAPFSETLPYPKKAAPTADVTEQPGPALPDAEEETELGFGGRITDNGDDQRAALVPLAGGLLLFVAAMWAWYVSRRSGDDRYLEAQ